MKDIREKTVRCRTLSITVSFLDNAAVKPSSTPVGRRGLAEERLVFRLCACPYKAVC
jgi:hypothetical protein